MELLSVTDFLFYVFATLVVVSSALVVLMRGPINSAMFMILALVGVGGLFFLLNAYFLGIFQVLVYAGAIMVLFVFIIMMLGAQERLNLLPRHKYIGFLGLITFAVVLAGFAYVLSSQSSFSDLDLNTIEVATYSDSVDYSDFTTSVKSFGYSLFTKYLLPFQVAGFLLLVAMLGVVVLSRRFKATNREESK